MRYVYLGHAGRGNNTYCHQCHNLLIERLGYFVKEYKIKEDRCFYCKEPAKGIGL